MCECDCTKCPNFVHFSDPSRTYCLKALATARKIEHEEEVKRFNWSYNKHE